MQRPLPSLAIERTRVGERVGIGVRPLCFLQGCVAVEVELLEDDRGMPAAARQRIDQARAKLVVRGIVVHLAEQAVAHGRDAGNELRRRNEAAGTDVEHLLRACTVDTPRRGARTGHEDEDDGACQAQARSEPRSRHQALTSAAMRMLQRTRSISIVSTEPRHQRIANDLARE